MSGTTGMKGTAKSHATGSGTPPSTWIETFSIQQLDAAPISFTAGYWRDPWGRWANGPLYYNNAVYFSYQKSCTTTPLAPPGTPSDVVAVKYDYLSGVWSQGVIGRTICGVSHELVTNLYMFPDTYSDSTLRRKFIQFWAVFPADDVPAVGCTNGNYCIRYKISTNPEDITSWGTIQYAHAVTTDAKIDFLPEGEGGFDSLGTLHVIGQGHGIGYMQMTSVSGALKFTYVELIDSTAGNLSNSPGCSLGAHLFPDDTMMVTWSPEGGACVSDPLTYDSTTRSLYFAKSTDHGATWFSADGSASFTRTSGFAQGTTAYRVATDDGNRFRNGQAITKLSGGTPLILASRDTTNLGHAVIYKWSSGNTWTAVVAGSPPTNELAAFGRTLTWIDDTTIFAHWEVYDYTANTNTLYEYKITSCATTCVFNSPLTLQIRPLGTTVMDQLRVSRVTVSGQTDRMLINWAAYNSGTPTPHQLYFLDRKIADAQAGTPPP